jgi:hypothetical protein
MPFGGFAPFPIRLGGTPEEGWAAVQHARASADLLAAFRTMPFAVLRYTKSGATVTILSYVGRNGAGLQHAPSVTVNGTGDLTFTWPTFYLDPYENSVTVNFRAGRAHGCTSTFACPTVTLTANTARVVVRNAAGTATDHTATLKVWGETGIESRAIGDYGGSPDKRDSKTEAFVPYAAAWYQQLQEGRGSAYTQKFGTLVHCENLAIARMFSAVFSRLPEKVRANAIPAKADEKLDYWVEVLGIPTRSDDPKWLVRQRCAAHFKSVKGPTLANVRECLQDLLGELLIDILTFEGTDLANPPEPTYWPGENPGPSAYSLGGGTWYSKRCHILIQLRQPSSIEIGTFLQLVNVDMFQLLDRMLPAWVTFGWVTFSTDGDLTGFLLDISQLDLTGVTES